MEEQNIAQKLEDVTSEVMHHRELLAASFTLLHKISDAINDGFSETNARLAGLEGKAGMQGVNQQLGEIKSEIEKIRKAYPYEDYLANMQIIKGSA